LNGILHPTHEVAALQPAAREQDINAPNLLHLICFIPVIYLTPTACSWT
jgi:hypothetical protein